MKKQKTIVLSFLITALCAVSAYAAQNPNLRVTLQGPSTAAVYSPYQYTVTVKNIGNAPAANVKIVVDLPETDTSPTKYILGTLTGIQTGCVVVTRKLQCTSTIPLNSNQQRAYTFNFELPISTKILSVKATGTTTTANEVDPLNNSQTVTQALSYGSITIPVTGTDVLISMCTGRGLTSFFECEIFPSSQQHHIFTLHPDMSVSVYGDVVGTWDQPSASRLHLYMVNGGTVIEHNGFARNGTCFEGMTTFTPNPGGYISPYKICVQ
jgi:uncharacterized repeat protein (TIGR01451 family)